MFYEHFFSSILIDIDLSLYKKFYIFAHFEQINIK